jgi:8-oxo-dGTP pyrophosphatase MutT (NUDIX family)
VSGATLWFDAAHTHAAAGVFLLTPDGRVILQLRDDIPGIDNPGMITSFGGAAEPGETPLQCALREIAEETGLRPAPDALHYLDALSKRDFRGNLTACVFYTLGGIEPASLSVTEGAPIVLSPAEVARDPRTTPFCKQLVAQIHFSPPPRDSSPSP